MKFFFGKSSVTLFLILAVAVSGAAGFYIGRIQGYQAPLRGVTNIDTGNPAGVDFSLFWDTWRVLQEKSAQSDNLDYQKMVYGAISGMVSSLDDPYTVFLDPKEARDFLDQVGGSFEGVGMEIGVKDKQLQVIAPLPGTPAANAGIRAADQILKIDGDSTGGITVDEAVSRIRGPKGTKVTLSILRDGWKTPKDFVIVRETIKVPALKWQMKDGVAYVQLFEFSKDAGSDFQKAANEIIDSGAKKIVLDLRNDPGGYLEVAQDIAGWFLSRDQTVVIEDFGTHGPQKVYKAEGNGVFSSYPVVVLINEGSASASEILAGALRDDRGVTLVGTKSFGKGSVQELQDLKDGSTLKVTVARWLTPKGISISKKGLDPDVPVTISDDDLTKNKDPQLDKALELLSKL